MKELLEAHIDCVRVVESSKVTAVGYDCYFDLVLIDDRHVSQRHLGQKPSALLTQCHERSPMTRLAVMSTASSRLDVLQYLSAGFHGYINKLQPDGELLAAVMDLLSGRIYVPRWFADGGAEIPDFVACNGAGLRSLKLTRRQNEILPLIAQGMSNEIASQLKIAEGTSKIHIAALLRALGARNRTEAAFLAAELVQSGNRAHSRFKPARLPRPRTPERSPFRRSACSTERAFAR